MTTRDLLLRNILERPDDLPARQVYADYLEEHREEALAEFIRVQIAVEPMRNSAHWRGAPRTKRVLLLNKERKIKLPSEIRPLGWQYSFNGTNWRAPAWQRAFQDTCALTVRNGFPYQLACTLEWFTEANAREAFGKWPIESVVLVDRRPIESGGEFLWFYHKSMEPSGQDHWIPNRIVHLVIRHSFHPTEAAAYADLDAACVAYGRRLAGLPALKEMASV